MKAGLFVKSFIMNILFIIIFSFCTTYGEEPSSPFFPVEGKIKKHTVQAGEDLYAIGLKYHVAIDHLMMANGISTLSVPTGTTLIIPSMRVVPALLETGIVLNLPERMLYLFDNGKLMGWFPVAIGAQGKVDDADKRNDSCKYDKKSNLASTGMGKDRETGGSRS